MQCINRSDAGWSWLYAAVVFAAACLGCGDDGLVQVTGVVSYQSQPLTRGLVAFHGLQQPFGAPLDGQGRFDTRLPPGEYQVTVSAPALPPADWREGEPLPEMKALVPARFALPKTSGLRVTVEPKGPAQVIDFPLK